MYTLYTIDYQRPEDFPIIEKNHNFLLYSWEVFKICCLLFIRSQKPGDFRTQKPNKRPWKHLPGFLRCVLEVVLWMCQNIKQCLYQFLILKEQGRF